MSRKHKKRTKQYSGIDASADPQPVVHRYTVVVRSPLGEWWQDHHKQVRTIAIIAGVALVIVFVLFELIDLLF